VTSLLCPELEDLKSRAGVFEEVSVVLSGLQLDRRQTTEHLEMLGGEPQLFFHARHSTRIGRLFGPQDFALGFAEATVISDGLCAVLRAIRISRKRLRMDNDPYTIVGVVLLDSPPGTTVAKDVEVWVTSGSAGILIETRAKREGGARGNRTAETWHRCKRGLRRD